jgi:amino acid transporter
MLAPDIYSGMGVGKAMAQMIGGGPYIETFVAILLIFALMRTIMTAMAGSSRTLYQASVDGWLPRYLSHVNEQGAPTRAMWTDLTFNLILLMMSDYLFILAARTSATSSSISSTSMRDGFIVSTGRTGNGLIAHRRS